MPSSRSAPTACCSRLIIRSRITWRAAPGSTVWRLPKRTASRLDAPTRLRYLVSAEFPFLTIRSLRHLGTATELACYALGEHDARPRSYLKNQFRYLIALANHRAGESWRCFVIIECPPKNPTHAAQAASRGLSMVFPHQALAKISAPCR